MGEVEELQAFNNGQAYPKTYDCTYAATKHISNRKLEIPEQIISKFKGKLADYSLLINDDTLIKEIVAGIIKGNIIFQGPPGTGKTTIAKALCESFNVKDNAVTAVADWSTYDTIGGIEPAVENGKETFKGKNGRIIDAIVDCCNVIVGHDEYKENMEQASWLIIDELNRCEIDKAFGEMFTVFGNDSSSKSKKVDLWFYNDDNHNRIYIPDRFRIIGTMNSIDKNFVYDISQGLSRRFSFITIYPPKLEDYDAEVIVAKDNAKKRVTGKMSEFKDVTISSDILTNIDNDITFKKYDILMKDFIKHVRYKEDEKNKDDSFYLNLQLGTAQIIDAYESMYIFLVLSDYENSLEKEDMMKNAVDYALSSRIIPQMDGFDYNSIAAFADALSSKDEYSFMAKVKSGIERLL